MRLSSTPDLQMRTRTARSNVCLSLECLEAMTSITGCFKPASTEFGLNLTVCQMTDVRPMHACAVSASGRIVQAAPQMPTQECSSAKGDCQKMPPPPCCGDLLLVALLISRQARLCDEASRCGRRAAPLTQPPQDSKVPSQVSQDLLGQLHQQLASRPRLLLRSSRGRLLCTQPSHVSGVAPVEEGVGLAQ